MSIMHTASGPPRRARRLALPVVAIAAALAFPAASLAAGPGGGGGSGGGGSGHGGGGGETTITNNLSFPTIWSDGVTMAMRGAYGSPQLTVPFTKTDANGNPLTLYLQGVEQNTWQAENVVATTPVNVSQVDWGDNIESRSLPLSKPIRVETTLLEDVATPMTGFTMFSASGSKDTEVFGTDGTQYQSPQAAIYSGCARLTIQRLEVSRNDQYLSRMRWSATSGQWTGRGLVSDPLFNGGVWAGAEGTGYSAEINGSGKVVYGYNWRTTGLTAGDYRLTFSLDQACPAATLNTFITPQTTVYTTTTENAAAVFAASGPGAGGGGSGGSGGGEGAGSTAHIDSTDNLSYIDVELGTPSYTAYVPPQPVSTALPTISGTAAQGQVLTATTGTWDNDPTAYSYQWQSCDSTGAACANIEGAVTGSYTLTRNEVGRTLRVAVTATNENGSATATSSPSAVVTPLAPVNTTLPAIYGSAQVGQDLLATNGTWENEPTTYSYQWQFCDAAGNSCADIAGASDGSYQLTDAVVGGTLRLVVTATNAGGSTSAAAAPTQLVKAQGIQAQLRSRARITLQLKWIGHDRLQLAGYVTPARNAERLMLQLRTRTGWRTVGTVTLRRADQQRSRYTITLPHMAGGVYRAYMLADPSHVASSSTQIRARSQAHATLRLQRQTHDRLRLSGTLSPARNGKHLVIQVRTRSGWKTFKTVALRAAHGQRSQYAISIEHLHPGVYRAYYAGDSQYRAGTSGSVTVR